MTCCDRGWGEDVTQKLNHLYFIAFADWPADKTGLPDAKEFDSPNGKGVTGKIDGKKVLLGNRLLMESEGVDTSVFEEEADQLRKDGATVIFAALDSSVCGLLAIADPVKTTRLMGPDLLALLLFCVLPGYGLFGFLTAPSNIGRGYPCYDRLAHQFEVSKKFYLAQ